jgi:hypothetical protein
MIPDRDIWTAANLLIRAHRADAEIVAARQADEMPERGDHAGNSCGLGSGGRLLQAVAVGKSRI